jgi:hypothetical protein
MELEENAVLAMLHCLEAKRLQDSQVFSMLARVEKSAL